MNEIRYVFFDVAGTLLGKPAIFRSIAETLKAFGQDLGEAGAILVEKAHRDLSEATQFPDKPERDFYDGFNRRLVSSLGCARVEKSLLDEIFRVCRAASWVAYDDTTVLDALELPMGILSNWDSGLEGVLKKNFGTTFSPILGSAAIGVAKPNEGIFRRALELVGLPPEHILYVGDSVRLDMIPALHCGLRIALIDRLGVFPSFPGRKMKSLHELKGICHRAKGALP